MAMKKRGMIFALGVAVLLSGCVSVEEIKQEADAGNVEAQYNFAMILLKKNRAKHGNEIEKYLMMATYARYLPAACVLASNILTERKGEKAELLLRAYDVIFAGVADSPDIEKVSSFLKRSCPGYMIGYIRYLDTAGYGEAATRLRDSILTDSGKYGFQDFDEKELRGIKTSCEIAKEKERLAEERQKRFAEERQKRLAEEEQKRLEKERQKRLAEEEQKRLAEEKQKRLAEEKQKRLVEEKRLAEEQKKFKFPYTDITNQHIKFYKHISSGISLKWFVREMGRSGVNFANEKMKYVGIQLRISGGPDVEFFFGTETLLSRREWEKVIWGADKNSAIPKGGLVACRITLPADRVTAKDVIEKYDREFPGTKYSQSIKNSLSEEVVTSRIVMKKNVKNITDILESESVRIEIVHQELEVEFLDKQNGLVVSELNADEKEIIEKSLRSGKIQLSEDRKITVTITDKILEKYFIDITDDVLEKARKAEEQARQRMAEKTLDF